MSRIPHPWGGGDYFAYVANTSPLGGWGLFREYPEVRPGVSLS